MVCNVKEIKGYNVTLDKIFAELSFLRYDYPDFYNWYHKKVVSGLIDNSRKIFLLTSPFSFGKVNGVLILKNTTEEKKICTLYVEKESRLEGFGKKLMDIAMNEFDGEKPLITISDRCIDSFKPLLSKYAFKEDDILPNYYLDGRCEYTYNGHLYLPTSQIYA